MEVGGSSAIGPVEELVGIVLLLDLGVAIPALI